MPNLRPPKWANLVRLYHNHLRLNDEQYDPRRIYWGTCNPQLIQRAIDEAFATSRARYRYPTIFERASVLVQALIRYEAFFHDCERVSAGVHVIEDAGYRFEYQDVIAGESLPAYFRRCSTRE